VAAPAVQFVVVVREASSVALVGDFNDWDDSATPMAPVAGNGVWTVTVPLAAGRYRYSFLVDGLTWLPDPAAPRALDDDFGRANSVVTVGGT
jgi:1,4-alpha-glucan branching enzyme